MFKKWIGFIFLTGTLLSACNSPLYNQTEGNVADIKEKAVQALQHSNDGAKTGPTLVVKKGMYVDTTPISLEREPSWLQEHIVIRGDQLPFSYYSRTIGAGAGSHVLTKYQTGLDPTVKATLSYSGTVKGALDLLASKTGYVYNVKGSSIYWQAFVTKTFDIAFMPGGTDYLLGKASGGSASSGGTGSGGGGGSGSTSTTINSYVSSDSSDSEFSSLKGTLNVWTDLNTTVKQLLSKEGRAFVSESTTSITVRDRPANVAVIGQYISNLNRGLAKQVLVKVQILDVTLQSGYNFGINWGLIAKAFHNSPFVLNGNYGTPVSITALTPQPNGQTTPQMGTQILNSGIIPGWTILFDALNQQGKTGIVSEPRVVCLNNQVSVIRIVKQEGYVASIQNTTLASGTAATTLGSVTSQVNPGTVITGLTLYILPKIYKDNILLQVNADLSTNTGFTTVGSAATSSTPSTQIMLPNIVEKHFNQRSMIRSGETLILSGFKQVNNTTGANQLLNSQALGGKGAEQSSLETIILITPIMLSGNGNPA